MTQTLNLAVMQWKAMTEREQRRYVKAAKGIAKHKRRARYRLAADIISGMPSIEDIPIGTPVAVVSSPRTKKAV